MFDLACYLLAKHALETFEIYLGNFKTFLDILPITVRFSFPKRTRLQVSILCAFEWLADLQNYKTRGLMKTRFIAKQLHKLDKRNKCEQRGEKIK